MKSLSTFVFEKLKLSGPKNTNYKYFPDNKIDLVNYIVIHFEHGNGDLTDIDVSKLDNLSLLFTHPDLKEFIYNDSIKEVDVTGWDVSNVVEFQSMFDHFTCLTEIHGLETWDMSKAESIESMFANCKNLKYIDVSNWDLSNVENATQVFDGCINLKEIYGLDTWKFSKKLYRLSYMFSDCKNLLNVDISNWNVSSCQWFSGFFYGCESLNDIDLSGWDTKSLYSCVAMFQKCTELKYIYGFDKFDLHKCVDAQRLFKNCKNLISIGDVSNLYMGRILSTEYMFEYCSRLIADCSKWQLYEKCKKTAMFRYTSKNLKRCKI